MAMLIGSLAAFGLLEVLNKLMGVRIGKGLPAFWFCLVSGLLTHLVLSI